MSGMNNSFLLELAPKRSWLFNVPISSRWTGSPKTVEQCLGLTKLTKVKTEESSVEGSPSNYGTVAFYNQIYSTPLTHKLTSVRVLKI